MTALAIRRLRWHWRVLDNPWWYAGSIVAMLATNTATLLWGLIVLANDNALVNARSHYAWITMFVPENVIAAFAVAGSLVQFAWLFLWLRPLRAGHWGYAIMCAGWLFVFLNVAVLNAPIFPTSGSLSATVAALAWYAYWSRPKPPGWHRGPAAEK